MNDQHRTSNIQCGIARTTQALAPRVALIFFIKRKNSIFDVQCSMFDVHFLFKISTSR